MKGGVKNYESTGEIHLLPEKNIQQAFTSTYTW